MKSNLLRYMVRISSLVYCLSNLTAIIHSLNFCITLSNPDAGFSVKSIFASCCVIVLAPPELEPVTTPFTALNKALTSIPEWDVNRISSVDNRAFTNIGDNS